MCKECEQSFCEEFCPEFSGYTPEVGLARRACSSCGSGIYGGDFYYVIDDEAFCEDCVEALNVTELTELFNFSKISYLVETLGGEYRRD